MLSGATALERRRQAGLSESFEQMVQHESRFSSFFVAVVALFVTCLVISNVIAVKLAMVQGLVLPAGIIIFPVSYLLADVLTEVYGYRAARRVLWLGFFCNLLAVAAIWIGGLLPAAPFWGGQAAYDQILGATPRILLASFAAYLVGEFANTMIMSQAQGRHGRAPSLGPRHRLDPGGAGAGFHRVHRHRLLRHDAAADPARRHRHAMADQIGL